jgi:hypothetical protein
MTFPPKAQACAERYNGKMDWTAVEIEAVSSSK